MIKTRFIPLDYFMALMAKPLEPHERKAIRDMLRDQDRYSKLTIKRYIYFWLIFNKYFEIISEEQIAIHETYGDLKETSSAFKERKQQEYNSKKLERAKKEEDRQNEQKKKGDKYFS